MPAIAEFTLRHRDPEFRKRLKEWGSGIIVAGDNYGQGSSREHAALAPLHLGVKAVVAKSFARIHRRNLISQGIVALTFADESDYDRAEVEQCWSFESLRRELEEGAEKITVEIDGDSKIELTHDFSEHEREILLAGGLLSYLREREPAAGDGAARARAGEERTVQQDAGEAAEGSEDGEPGVIRQSAQGVGGQHE